MISQCLDRFLHLDCQNTFSGLDHSVQRRVLIFYHCEVHHRDVQYFCVLTPLVDIFHVKLKMVHPKKNDA